MAGVGKRGFDSPDESRTPSKTRSDIVHLGGTTAAPVDPRARLVMGGVHQARRRDRTAASSDTSASPSPGRCA